MEALLSKIFRNSPAGYKPQIGFAGKDKVGKLWLPGKKRADSSKITRDMNLPICGCTQLSFKDWFAPAGEQDCYVCWVGLDIDADDNPGISLVQWADKFVQVHPTSMVRLSCGGSGLHMIWILAEPIKTTNAGAGRIIKNIAQIYKSLAEADGIHVCQANRRMFWLSGGKNQTIYESDFVLKLENIVSSVVSEEPKASIALDITPGIQKYVNLLTEKKVFRSQISQSNKVYVGDAVSALRELGETVKTKSRMRGNGHINGYIDIKHNSISLWSYADGHVIWAYTDLEDMFDD